MNIKEYLLECLSEECAETSQRVSKALRFGLDEIQPEQPLNNEERICEELRDILAVAKILEEDGIISWNYIPTQEQVLAKRNRIAKYAKISVEKGTLPASDLEDWKKTF